MKLKEIIIYIITIVINITLSYFINFIIFGNNKSMLILSACGFILLSTLITFIVSNKMNYKLDIFAYDIKDIKHLILNSIFIGNLFTIPIIMFVSLGF